MEMWYGTKTNIERGCVFHKSLKAKTADLKKKQKKDLAADYGTGPF